MATLTVRTKIGGVLADVTAVRLSDPAGTYGMRRDRDGLIVVADGTAMVRSAAGTYTYTVALDQDTNYTWWAEVSYGGELYRVERRHYDALAIAASPLDAAVKAIVAADAGLAALIADRLYPVFLPQGVALPAVVYHEIDGVDGMTIDGPIGLVDGRVQFTGWAATHAGAVALRQEVIRIFKANLSGVYGGLTLQGTQVVGRGDIVGLNPETEQLTRFGKYVDVILSYNE